MTGTGIEIGGEVRPLNQRQTMIWTGQMLDPDVPLYNMAHAFTLDAPVDVDAFTAAFSALVAGCDALRTVIGDQDGQPVQRIGDDPAPPLPIIDLSGRDDVDDALATLVEDRARRRFDLAERLYDSALIDIGNGRHVWYLNQHHLICDAWAVSLLLQRQSELYQLAVDGRLDEAEPLPAYVDFLDAESDAIGSKAHQRAAAFWDEKLAGPAEPLTFYGSRPDDAGVETVRITAPIDGDRAERLSRFLTEPEVAALSPELTALRFFNTVLFAYLHRVCGVEQLTIGTPFHNRSKRAAKQTVGLFMNMFPVSAEVVGDQTMAELSATVGEELFETMANARFPLPAATEASAFEVVLNYLQIPHETFADQPVDDRWVHCGAGDRTHSLRLQVRRTGDAAYDLHFDVKTALFDDEARAALVDHVFAIIDAWLDDVHVPIAAIDLLTPVERQRLITDFNAESALATGTLTVVDEFEARVAADPAAPAVSCGDDTVSYDQLDRRANRVANELIARGVQPGDYVGVLLPRGIDAVAAMLGVLKAGAGYVPMEPGAPQERLAAMLGDTDARVVCADHTTEVQVRAGGAEPLVVSQLGTDREGAGRGTDPRVTVGPDDPAYVMFTSGSTGRPKGVPITHRGLANYVGWARASYTDGERRAFALFTSLGFDLTITSIFVPLTSGGSIVAYPDDGGDGTPAVVDVWSEARVDVVKLTPSHLSVIRQLGLTADRLKVMIVGGEDFTTDLAADVQATHPAAAIYNEYGPTEAVVGCMLHRFDHDADRWPSVPIGRPGAGAEIYLLDGNGSPVPPGVIGELHIGGPGVAAGYLGRPDLTAERFVPRPAALDRLGEAAATPAARLYRTGDLGRWRPGTAEPELEFLGRADDQVKLRGYRIELGEIEAALAGHPGVDAAAVTVFTETIGGGPAGSTATEDGPVVHCSRCGLPSNFPDATFTDGVCSLCRDFDTYRDKVDAYFKELPELRALAEQIKAERGTKPYDCVVLLSGGKDSTYMLYQVVALGLRPLVFTLDNGFISRAAIANCQRVCDDLGVELEIGSTEHMNEIFRDSLDRFSNVCNGCFKTIYTLSMNLARHHGCRYIVTGLARGQLFETRLSDMYNHRIFDVDQIDDYVLEARKAYHHIDDAVSELLDVSAFADDAIFDEITFVDFYRYADVALDDVLSFLAEHTPWERPADTGRSTNCLINDVGIHVHRNERGFHNYALPYSWDVRLGHKVREAALDELDDDIDEAYVNEVLVEIGYQPKQQPAEQRTSRLVAHYQAGQPLDSDEIRSTLARSLPDYMIPTAFVHHDALPLTGNGKIDRAALPPPGDVARADAPAITLADVTDRQAATTMQAVWGTIFGHDIALGDNFFDLGGDSIIAIQIVDRAASAGLALTPRQLFEAETVAAAAEVATWVERDEHGAAPGPTEPDAGPAVFPLTPTQSGMLFHTLAEPGSGVYAGHIVHDLSGPVDRAILEQRWGELVERTAMLRTVFRWEGEDRASQRVLPDAAPAFRFEQWDDPEPEARLERFLADDRAAGFDLAAEPAVRLALIVMPSRTVLVWSFHHIVLDGWSIALAINELLDSYQATVDDTPWMAPDRRPFSSYLDWLDHQDQQAAERFWREELASFDATTTLPKSMSTLGPQPAAPQRVYGSSQRDLAAAETEALQVFAAEQRVTMSTVIQAAWALVLGRYDGSDDVVFGVTTSGRPASLPGADTMVGMLVATLPARVAIDRTATTGDWLRSLQRRQLQARDHEFASLVDVQRWSDLPAGQPLFESILVVENFPDYEPPEGSEALTIDARAYRVQSNYPLSLIVLPGETLALKAVYDRNDFDDDVIDRLLDNVEAAIAAIVTGGSEPVAELATIDRDEAARLAALADGPPLETEPTLLPELIANHATDRPGAVAVTAGDERLSYGELGARASTLAATLRDAGVGPGTFVGVRIERSVDMIVAIVAVHRAGGAYVPLDPSYPDERLDVMLADAGASLVLVSTADGIQLDRTGAEPMPPTGAGEPLELVDRPVEAADPAYLIYTSGSTGTPNGVPISHGNLAFSTAARFDAYPREPAAFLLLSSYSFDSSIVGIFWTLAAGGTIVLPRQGEELDVQALAGLIERERVTHTLALPSLYRLLLDFADPRALASLDTVIVAGEACPPTLLDAHTATVPDAELYNEYGPTEASVWCTVHRLDAGDAGPVPIGRPIPGATVAVLDRDGRPAGVGVGGEIHVAGPGLAAGYHDRPELTAARFVEIDGRRWYRTKDRGTMGPDGVIEFGGRLDSQVKIRGHRVELEEVEAALADIDGVAAAAAAVATGPTARGGDRLVACVEAEPSAAPSGDDLRAAVGRRLPEVFVPSTITVVAALPRLANGKIDRHRVVELATALTGDVDRSSHSPQTEQERQIAAIWAELLPAGSYGVDDDFFDVGGDSLLAVSLVERIRRATGARLPLATLLDRPTIAGLAAQIAPDAPAVSWQCLVPLRTAGTRVPLYLIPPAAGTALSFRAFVANTDPDQPLYCFEPLGSDGQREPHDTVEAMAEHYIAELEAAQPDGRYRIGGSCLGAIVAWEMARRLADAGKPVELLVFLDPGPPHSGPGWTYNLPSQRSPRELITSIWDIVTGGELLSAVQAVWRRNTFDRIGRIHYRAQLSYVADRLTAPIIWLESEELAETRPDFCEQWRILAGDDLTPIVVPATTHDGLMTGQPDEVQRMAQLFDEAMAQFDRPAP